MQEALSSIPRKIHYCWFGMGELGVDERRCIESWKRFFPGWEILRWDESNFDLDCNEYVRAAYDAGMWAFVSDFARFSVLFECGGLYFDTDVEVIRSFEDIIDRGAFMGFESDGKGEGVEGRGGLPTCTVAPGLGLGAPAGLPLYSDILDSYEDARFLRADGSQDLTTVVARVTQILADRGLRDIAGIQRVAGVSIYPSEYFNPKDFLTGRIHITENTRSIHHFGMSWLSQSEVFEHQLVARLLGLGLGTNVASFAGAGATAVRFGQVSRMARWLRSRCR